MKNYIYLNYNYKACHFETSKMSLDSHLKYHRNYTLNSKGIEKNVIDYC